MRRSTLRSIVVATFAASALITSTAAAKPVEPIGHVDRIDRLDSPTSSLAGTTESNVAPKQDLRGEHAQESARLVAQAQIDRGEQARNAYFLRRQPTQDLRGEHARDAARGPVPAAKPPVYWAYDYQAPKPAPQPVSVRGPESTGGIDDVWLVLGIAVGASAILAGAAIVFTRRWRIRVPA
jgi:hypothetical protein